MQIVTSDPSTTDTTDCFLTARQTRARYGGASDMWLHRRLHDDSGFPQPVFICGRRFWKLADLVAWERQAVEQPATTASPRRGGFQKLGDVVADTVAKLDPIR
jgi:hypothetical protein